MCKIVKHTCREMKGNRLKIILFGPHGSKIVPGATVQPQIIFRSIPRRQCLLAYSLFYCIANGSFYESTVLNHSLDRRFWWNRLLLLNNRKH